MKGILRLKNNYLILFQPDLCLKKGMIENMDKKDEDDFDYRDDEIGEDATEYGEFISTYFAWIPPEKQKERAKELHNMTKNNKKERKNEKKI